MTESMKTMYDTKATSHKFSEGANLGYETQFDIKDFHPNYKIKFGRSVNTRKKIEKRRGSKVRNYFP